MDKSFVQSVLTQLKSYSSREIQEALINLKNNILCNAQGTALFKDCGGLNYILPHIKKPNERTLDLSLSILGNLCLDEQNSLDVAKSNIFGPLVTVIKTVKRDSLLGRTSRLIGNLSQIQSNAESFHNYGAAHALVDLINSRDKGTSYPTLIMAVRALRLLWMVQSRRHEMLSMNAVHCIVTVLYDECQSMGLIKPAGTKDFQITEPSPKKSQHELICGILKCMGYFSTFSFQYCADQIGPRGFDCLVVLMETHDTALKCLLNLCYMTTSRTFLGASGLVEGLVHILQRESDVSQWPHGVVKALTQLCRESTNRARLRLCGGLPVLLKAARYHTHAFRALLYFSYDEKSFQILLQEGLVSLVTTKLTSYVAKMDYDHSNTESEIVEEDNVTSLAIENPKMLTADVSPTVSKTACNKKSAVRSNSHIEDAINYESQVRKRRKILKRANSCSYRSNKETSESSSDTDSEPTEQCATHTTSVKSDLMSGLADGYSSGFGSEYGGSTASKRARWDMSPESGVSTGDCSTSPDRYAPWSPTSSGPTSPISVNEVSDESDSELSGRYSPVCGEPDEEDNVPAPDEPEVPDACNMETLVIYEESDNEPLPSEDVVKDLHIDLNSNFAYIVNILFRVAFRRGETAVRQCSNTIKYLTDEHCINGLLDYMSKAKFPIRKVAKILLKIMRHRFCLMDILNQKLPLKLYQKTVESKHSLGRCIQCKRFVKFTEKMLSMISFNAETYYGVGKICHQLLKGAEDEKQTMALTLPYIIKSPKSTKIFLIDCNALNLLFNKISASEDLETCITGLHHVAKTVNIKNPKFLELRYKEYVIVNDDSTTNNLPESDIVTFLLDDLSTVNTSKSFLCDNSEVFSAMLMGQFKESSEKCVQLKNVSQSALKYLITLLQFGLHESTGDIEMFPIPEKLETSLEVLLLVDRFLFDKLKDLLRSAILQFQLTVETADKIYIWSLEEGMGFLCVEAVAYILTENMKDKERLQLFQNILGLEYKNQWLEDIKAMLLRQLEK